MSYFSKNLEYLRKSKNISRAELAEKIKVNQSTISRWENEDMGVTVDNAYDIAKFFNISIADLTGKDLSVDTTGNNSFTELEILFDKHKDILTEDDKEYIKFIIEKRKKEIDKELGEK